MPQKQDRTSNNTNQTNENTPHDNAQAGNTQVGNTPRPADQRRFIDKHFGKMMGAVIVLTLLVNAASVAPSLYTVPIRQYQLDSAE